MRTTRYDVALDVRTGVRGEIRSMGDLTDLIADALEARGLEEHDYYVEVKGPPEIHIGVSRA